MKAIFYLTIACLMLMACNESVSTPSIVFMDNARVFEEFEMKKEYDTRIQKDLEVDAAQLDSLRFRIQSDGANLGKDELQQLQQYYYQLEQRYKERFGTLSTQYTSEVNERLNGYIDAYAKEKGYDMIIGSGGQGNVMYVDTTLNITSDLIKYINKKFGE
jgi:outer membrane protein